MGESRTLAGKARWKSRKAGEQALRYVLPGYVLPGGLRHRTGGPHFPATAIGRIKIEDGGAERWSALFTRAARWAFISTQRTASGNAPDSTGYGLFPHHIVACYHPVALRR